MWVMPVSGRLVRDPRTKAPVPEQGREVPDNEEFWVRRLRDGDIVLGTKPQPPVEPPAA